jgi:esterase/lipase
MQCGI